MSPMPAPSYPAAPTYYTPAPAEHYTQQPTQIVFPMGGGPVGQVMYLPQGVYPQQQFYGAPQQTVPMQYYPGHPDVYCGQQTIAPQECPQGYAQMPAQYVYAPQDENIAPGMPVPGYSYPRAYMGASEYSANSSFNSGRMNNERNNLNQNNMGPPPGIPLQTVNGPQTGSTHRTKVLPRADSRPISSTPIPTEATAIPPPMNNQNPRQGHINSQYQNYQRPAEEDVLANLSRITINDNENDELDMSRSFVGTPRRENSFSALPPVPSGAPSERPNRGYHQRRSLPPPVPAHLQTGPTSYKTRPCAVFGRMGFCELGPGCRFAHGSQDLRNPTRVVPNPKYKTRLCKNFFTGSKVCPYGARCEFIHREDAEYAEHAAAQSRREREQEVHHEENLADVTPAYLPSMPLPPSVTQSADCPNPRPSAFMARKSVGREWARSMVCIPSHGTVNDGESEVGTPVSSAMSSSQSHANLTRAASMRNINKPSAPLAPPSSPFVPLKFMRRRSMSQLNLNKKNLSFEKRPSKDS